MKALVLSMLFVSSAAFADVSISLKGEENINAEFSGATDLGRYIIQDGIVKSSAQITLTNLSVEYVGYTSEKICVERSNDYPNGEPEMAECVKFETHWSPDIVVSATAKNKFTFVDVSASSSEVVTDSLKRCLSNLKELEVVGDTKPTTVPSRLDLERNCSVGLTMNSELKNLTSQKLQNAKVEASLEVYVTADVNVSSITLVNGKVSDVDAKAIAAYISSSARAEGYSNNVTGQATVKTASGQTFDLFNYNGLRVTLE